MKEERTGAGTKALKQLTDFADKAGVTLRLTPSPLKQVAPVEGWIRKKRLLSSTKKKEALNCAKMALCIMTKESSSKSKASTKERSQAKS